MLKAIRNVIFVLSGFFVWGIVGSIELERLALSEGMVYIAIAFGICAVIALFELAFRAAKVLLTVYAIRRKRAPKKRYAGNNYTHGRVSV